MRIDGKTVPFTDSILLTDALRACGASLSMPCGGRGSCGKCVVWAKGRFGGVGEAEAALLRRNSVFPEKEGFTLRLACFCHFFGDGEVRLPEIQPHAVSDAIGSLPPYDGDRRDAIGFSVDIGTTTIAIRQYALSSGKLLSTRVEMNDQSRFGADVLSRIEHSNTHGVKALQQILIAQLSRMFDGMQAAYSGRTVERVVLVGNTTMLHFLTGLDPRGIGVSPFQPQSLFGETFSANTLFPMFSSDTEAYIPRCVSAYVGADISAGMLATAFDRPGRKLLLDVGTNGEIALQNGERIVCCATAAGPAFEGAQLSMGMPAIDGAIDKVFFSEGIGYQTIGNAMPRGICGTGVISLLSLLRKEGILSESGLLSEENKCHNRFIRTVDDQKGFMIGDSGVFFSIGDIQQIQLAKAAIAAGIDTLLHEENIDANGIAEFLLAGGFGSRVCASDAAEIGLIPGVCVNQTVAVGNVALHGASMMLFSMAHRKRTDQIVQSAVEKPLSGHPFFMDRYIANMMFPGVNQ